MSTNYNDDKCCSMWKKILTTSFWVIYPIMGVCFLHVLWLMNDRMDNIMVNSNEIFEKPEPFKDIEGPLRGNVIKGVDIALLKTPSEEMIAKGAKLYASKCVTCHGSTGDNGTLPNARKFGKDPFKNGRELSNVFKTITTGIAAGGMPPFDTETAEDRIALAHHIRSYSKLSPKVTDEDIKKLDKEYSVTVDKGAPHQIPIAMSIEILVEESNVKSLNVSKLLDRLHIDDGKSAEFLKSVSNNLKNTLISFNNSKVWKTDYSSFVKFISVNIQSSGLQSKMLVMEKAKLDKLHKYLVELYK
ncbi:MAG: hypothetical protein COA79_08105 [Planctomycetota bacterium]|nr:MAG: hypothetical protein COA79_08105 [Planctomycetota bacterium]